MFTRWLIFHVASGQAFFSGAICLILAVYLSTLKSRRSIKIMRNALVALGGIFVAISATPLPPWFYFLLLITSLLWLIGEACRKYLSLRVILGLRIAVAAIGFVAVLWELPYHLSPRVPHLERPVLGIIGDSVTAGLGDPKVVTWPGIVSDHHGVKVRDHSRAGAGLASAMRQAKAVSSDETLVILEIGGNDILGGTPPEEFEEGLANLLSALRQPGRVIVMLELPLPPSYNIYGRIQRRLAQQYKTLLVPKRVLLGILQQQGATLDSIHLTQEGQQGMADAVWNILYTAYE